VKNSIVKKMFLLAAGLLLLVSGAASAQTYYVGTNGSDPAGSGTRSSPWATIGYGLNRLSGGDTLVVLPGTYRGSANFINDRMYNIPSGTAGNYTTIKAETPFSVRLESNTSLGYWDNMLAVQGQYINVDGFIFNMTNTLTPSHVGEISGSYIKLTRVIFRRAGDIDEYGGWLYVGGSYNLIEDCAGVGAARYGFETGGPNSNANHNIFRRCVGRVDYSNSPQPKATFAMYGNNSGSNARDVLYQNCIAIDGRRGPSGSEDTYGGFYFPKNAAGVKIQGSIVLNNEAGHAGYFIKELQGSDITLENSIAWGIYGGQWTVGVRANGSTGSPLILDHVTIGASPFSYWNQDSAVSRILRNSLFYDNGGTSPIGDYGWSPNTNNAFRPANQAQGNNAITQGVSLKYIVRPEAGSVLDGAGTDGKPVGASVTKRYGVSGTLWGEPGFDIETSEELWPWAYENVIKSVFSESNPPPAGNVPSTNNTTRGFCATGNDQWGQPMTLTRYIWQYLGNQIPASVYSGGGSGGSTGGGSGGGTVPDTTPPAAPTGLVVIVSNG